MKYIVCVVLLCCIGCSSHSTEVKPSPLSAQKQKQLQCALLGSWKLTRMDTARTDDRMFVQKWTFLPNGNGHYEQQKGTDPTLSQAVVEAKHKMKWILEGRNLRLSRDDGTPDVFYRADQWTEKSMSWFNYALSNQYYLVRTADGDASSCLEEARPSAGDQTPSTDTTSPTKTPTKTTETTPPAP